MVHWWCTDDALMMHWWCADDVLMMHWCCSGDALMMQWWCTDDALMMHWWLVEHWWCTGDALVMHWWSTDNALMMHCQCADDELMMHLAPLGFAASHRTAENTQTYMLYGGANNFMQKNSPGNCRIKPEILASKILVFEWHSLKLICESGF